MQCLLRAQHDFDRRHLQRVVYLDDGAHDGVGDADGLGGAGAERRLPGYPDVGWRQGLG